MLICGLRLFAQSPPTSARSPANWPAFRGGAGAVVPADVAATLPDDWDGPSGRNILWKSPVPLPGQSSPIVWNDSIFLTGATPERQEVFCFAADSGALRWRTPIGAPDAAKAPKVMEDTGYAAATMATDGRHVFAMFATGDVAALDFSGKIIWFKSLGMPVNQYGLASSLLTWQNRLIIQFDQALEPGAGMSELLALDGDSGDVVWRTPRPVANSWTSPILVTTPTGPQIITAANPFAIAYEPQRGTELWRAKCLEGDVAPSPAYANGLAIVAMENALVSAIKTGGQGDVTKTHAAWTAEEDLPDIVSPVATDRFVFIVKTFGTVTCYELASGTKLWSHEFDGPFHASPVAVGEVIYLTDRAGTTHRFAAAPQFKLLNAPSLGEPVSATLAATTGRIYIRGKDNLYGIGKR
jgi:outer membrane protein assembly factor BamB